MLVIAGYLSYLLVVGQLPAGSRYAALQRLVMLTVVVGVSWLLFASIVLVRNGNKSC